MHRRHEPWGVSAYAAQVALAELTAMRPAPRSRVRLSAEVLEQLNPHRVAELRGTLREAAALGAFRVPPSADPWYAARVTSRLEGDLALEHARALADGELGQAREVLDAAFEEVGIPAAATVSDYAAGLRLLDQVRGTLEVFRPEAWDSSVREAVAATAPREWRTANGVKLGSMARRRIVGPHPQAAPARRAPGRPARAHWSGSTSSGRPGSGSSAAGRGRRCPRRTTRRCGCSAG